MLEILDGLEKGDGGTGSGRNNTITKLIKEEFIDIYQIIYRHMITILISTITRYGLMVAVACLG